MPKLFITDDDETVEKEIDLSNYNLSSAVDQFKLIDTIKEALAFQATPKPEPPERLVAFELLAPSPEPQPKPEYPPELVDLGKAGLDLLDKYLYLEWIHGHHSASP